MRIATWNVNSLKARLDKVMWWLERARPDVLLMQETKLADPDSPTEAFRTAGYELAHHGEGRWNGVAIASRCRGWAEEAVGIVGGEPKCYPSRSAARPLPSAEERDAQALADTNAPLTVTELRRACRIRTATLCAILSQLVGEGRIRRTPAGYLPAGR